MVGEILNPLLNLFFAGRDEVEACRALLIVEPPQIFDAGIRRLLRIVGELHDRPALPRRVDGRQLVDPRKCRVIAARHEVRAHSPHIDGGFVVDEALDDLLVEFVGDGDRGIGKPRLVEPPANHPGQIGDVARIETHPETIALLCQLFPHFYRIDNAGFERIIGVDEKHRVFGIDFSVCLKGLKLAGVGHDPGVCHRP
ncbi:hypothetical protein SDC9_188339 [bioreactor metagenome]|uniref:Uncharacterized protein n=1 Tax=bioreactor metagenome TaxID=1076179 RepID=A0A645HPN2_9ZZZZ